jgi:hypothetical protein
MGRFAIVGPDYVSQSPIADCEMTMNFVLEQIESGQGKSQAALYCTPGLKLLANLPGGQGRGIHTAQGRTFCVVGTQLLEGSPPLNAPVITNWSALSGVQIVSDGNPVCMASGPTQLLITSAGNMYVFDLRANTLTQVPVYAGSGNGLLGSAIRVRYLLGFFYAVIVNSLGITQIQQSLPLDGSQWDPLAQTAVLDFSDNIIEIFEDHLILWVFGPKKIVPYQNTGASPFALDPSQGGIIEQGLAAVNSVAQIDNSIFWIGADTRGQGIVWRGTGYAPQRISTFALENELNSYSTISDAVCYAYQEAGHTYYVMNFPTAKTTRVYDCATGTWHRRGSWNSAAGVFLPWRAGFHTFTFGAHLVLDPSNGNVYQQSIAFLDDAGQPLKRVRRSPHISNEQEWIFHTKLQIDVETGLGPNLPGKAAPTVISMLDAAGVVRKFGVADGGIIQAPVDPIGDPLITTTLFMNDLAGTTSWQITISPVGVIIPVQVTFNADYSQSLKFVSNLGDQTWLMQLKNLGGGISQLKVLPLGTVQRGPEIMLRWSNDGGKTWCNERKLDCGSVGDYLKRVILWRLGRSRDRVYEISVTDPCAWRIIDAYLFTQDDAAPSSRYAVEARKRA